MKILIQLKDIIRKYLYSRRKLGIYIPLKTEEEEHGEPAGNLFGKRIGKGSGQDVFENLENPDKVLKIQRQAYATKTDMLKAISQYQRQNKIPMFEQTNFEGYVEGLDYGSRTMTVYYPVFSQNKIQLVSDDWDEWENELLPKLEIQMRQNGIKVYNHIYTYKKYSIDCISPYNVGIDISGNYKFTVIHIID